MSLQETSKYMSLILRHKPETIGITLDEHGWASVEELIAGISKTHEFNREMLEEIVRTDNKQRYLENKELNKRRRAIQNRIDKAEAEIERLESEIAGLNDLMSNPAIEQQKLETAYKMSAKLNEELEQQMSLWEEASMEMEEFEKENTK